jgi:hypothetical protein
VKSLIRNFRNTMAPKKMRLLVEPTPEATMAPKKTVSPAKPTPEAAKTTPGPGQLASPAEPVSCSSVRNYAMGNAPPAPEPEEPTVCGSGALVIHDGWIFDWTWAAGYSLRDATMEAGSRLSFSEFVSRTSML